MDITKSEFGYRLTMRLTVLAGMMDETSATAPATLWIVSILTTCLPNQTHLLQVSRLFTRECG